jgi:hypothetical protein
MLPQQQIYNFLRTVTISFSPLNQYINTTLLQKGYAVNDGDKSSWKYYLNMVGRYHVADELMYVTSVDTHEQILFSPDVLKDHPRTRAAYVPGGPFYNRLCELYPDQVDLIKSILFPVESLEKAILSDDLVLLNYGTGYLEEHEESVMIMKIEEFLEILKERWYFDFLDDEPYFHITFWSSLFIQLAGLLMTARVEHIRTPYVHSFDLWSSLKAQGLDDYSDILGRDKAMMLYQNMPYFRENAGKQKNLDILTERLLGDLGIGVYGRVVIQQAEKGADNYQLTPQLIPVRLPVTSDALPAPIETKTVTVIQAEILEKGLTDSNSEEMVSTIERKLGDTQLNEYATKFLEIRPVAQNKPYSELLNGFLMETLMVAIKEGYYLKPIEVRDPLTNELIFMSPQELLALYNYAVNMSMGVELTNFPNTISLLRSFTTTVKTPAIKIPYLGGELYISQMVDANQYLSGFAYDTQIESPAEFTTMVTRQWLRFMDHHLADQGTVIEKARAAYQYLSSMCHERRDESISLVDGFDDYQTWLGVTGINFTNTIEVQYNLQTNPRIQWANLADTIINTLIPINDTLGKYGNFTLSNFGFERLRQLFVQMCSYRVVFLQSDRDTSEHVVGGKWTTGYGPDTMEVHSDFLVACQAQTHDATHISRSFYVHRGIVQEEATNATNHVGYSVTTTVTDQHDSTTMKAEQLRPTVFTVGTTMTQGTLMLSQTSMTPVGISSAT